MRRKIYEEILARVMAFMPSPSQLLIEKCHVGSGKTWNTIKALEDNGYQWIYLAPFHTVIDENLRFSTLRTYNYLHLKSRGRVCLVPVYKRLAESSKRIDIRPICESSCPLKDTTCPYYEIKRQLYDEPQSWAGVHHHLRDFIKDFFDIWINRWPMSSYYDVMIIDENPINVLFENEMTDAEELANLRDITLLLGVNHNHVNNFVDLLDYLVVNFHGNRNLNYDETFNLFKAVDFNSFYEKYQEALVEALITNQINLNMVPREYIKTFAVMNKDMTREKIPSMVVKKLASPYTRKKYHFMAFNNSSLLACPIKIIGLDGTANIKLWETITGREASVLERKYIYKNIYQLKGQGQARYPLSSWIRYSKITSSGKKLCTLIDIICEKKKYKVLVACTKPLQPYIFANTTAQNIMFCNYYYIRSRNDFYEKCDTLILSCEPNIQEFQLQCFANLSDWDQEMWRQIFTQEEMIQTVGRIREDIDKTIIGREREPREIFIFPYTPPTNNGVDINKALYKESRIYDYTELLSYLKTGKLPQEIHREREDDVYDYIVDNDIGKIHRNHINAAFNEYSYNECETALRGLLKRGLLKIDGNGYRRDD